MRELIEEWKYFELPEIIDRKIDPLAFLDWKVKKIVPLIGFRRLERLIFFFILPKNLVKRMCYT